MHDAVQRDWPDGLNVLIESGSRAVTMEDARGYTPMHVAATNGSLGCFKILAERSKHQLSERCREGQTPLIKAVMCDREHVFNAIMECDETDINALDIYNNSALSYAIIFKRFSMADRLISHPLIVTNFVNNEGKTLLHHAAFIGSFSLTSALIERNKFDSLFIQHCDNNGKTALRYAIQEKRKSCAELISENSFTQRSIFDFSLEEEDIFTIGF
ncbi:MAG: hypothetical protein BVN35_17615 [Proteobacteria bacterium ST_bin11]|nr:MAG: hypothetical protein BVN35_17615 [Proteobacteria bacterium ST_bin11]